MCSIGACPIATRAVRARRHGARCFSMRPSSPRKPGTRESAAPIEFRRPSAKVPRWRVPTYGGLAAAVLAGLLIAPHFLTPSMEPMTRTAPITRLSPLPANTPEHAAEKSAATEQPAPAEKPAASAATQEPRALAKPRALAGNVRPSQNPALGAVAGDDARREPMAQGRAHESAPASQLAQMQAMRAAPSAARDMASPPPAAPSPDAATALREAAQSGNLQRLQALLAGGTDIDARDAGGRTALMLAVLHDQTEAVNSLLAAGADPNAADTSGTTPLEAALARARPEITAALRRAGAR